VTSGGSAAADAFRPLAEEHAEAAARLSEQAGWNQTPEDWRRLARLAPGGVRVLVEDGAVIASWSAVGFGDVAWIGMILVEQGHRGRGLGMAALDQALATARAAGHRVIGLDATDLGEPLYRRRGFETIAPIVRWHGTVAAVPRETGSADCVSQCRRGLAAGVLELDARHAGVDRGPLLADLATTATLVSLERGGETVAYAAIRPGRVADFMGPVVADDGESFAAIVQEATRSLAGRPVMCDLLAPRGAPVLESLGLSPARQLARMTLPRSPGCLCGPGIWCGAGFELG
jgi:GNAT superfamily N-acetyltransferase